MALVDQVIQESLRVYPPAPQVIRRNTTQDIKLKTPEGLIEVREEKCVCVYVSLQSLHWHLRSFEAITFKIVLLRGELVSKEQL